MKTGSIHLFSASRFRMFLFLLFQIICNFFLPLPCRVKMNTVPRRIETNETQNENSDETKFPEQENEKKNGRLNRTFALRHVSVVL